MSKEDEVTLEGYGMPVRHKLEELGCRYDKQAKRWIAPSKAAALVAQYHINNPPKE